MKLSTIARQLLGAAVAVSLVTSSASVAFAQAACHAPSDVFLNPFDRDSAHHRPIGTGAQYASDSHPATRDWLKGTRFGINVGGPWGVDVAKTDGSDPIRTVRARAIGTPVENLPADMRMPKNGIITNVAPGATDGVATFVDSTSGVAHQLRQFDWNGGNPVAAQYYKWPINGLGHGTRMGDRQGTSASGVAAMFGILRGFEINTPGRSIDHVLQAVLPRTPGCNIMLSRDIILPAVSRDGTAGQAVNNTGNIPYGALMALPRSVNINSLGLSEAGARLARAIQNYGIRIVDGGGCGHGAIRADQHVDKRLANQLIQNDIPKIYGHIRMVTNGAWQPGQAASGGGQPIARNCAYNAGATNVAAPSTGQSSGSQVSTPSSGGSAAAPAPSQPQSSGNNTGSQAGTPSGPDWEQAIRFWNWAQSSVPNMQNFAPGTPQHEQAKTNYERNINNYIQAAARAGIRVDANTPPEHAVAGSTAGSSSGGSAPATGNTQPSAPQQAQNTGGNQSTAGNTPPRPGTAEARFWHRAIQFYDWAQMSVPNLQRFAPGTPQHEQAKTNYQRNIGLYISYAARAGVTVNASTPPDRAFG